MGQISMLGFKTSLGTESYKILTGHMAGPTVNFVQKYHDDIIKWKHFPRYWPIVRGIHQSPVNSPHKGQSHGALMFSLICAWINGWVNNHEASDLRCHRTHYDIIVKVPTGFRTKYLYDSKIRIQVLHIQVLRPKPVKRSWSIYLYGPASSHHLFMALPHLISRAANVRKLTSVTICYNFKIFSNISQNFRIFTW